MELHLSICSQPSRLKLSSNEPMQHDWNKIIVNKILSQGKSFLLQNVGGNANQVCCTRYTCTYTTVS